jgi:hypothetical protein
MIKASFQAGGDIFFHRIGLSAGIDNPEVIEGQFGKIP